MFRILLVLLFVLSVPTKTLAAKYALVIGNDNYKSVPRLAKARNDARTISEFLKDTGFNVVKLEDATYREMVKAIDAFSRKLGPDDQAVFFFAGHGVQLQNGNYLLPVDVDSENEAMVQMTSYNLDDITYLTGRHKSGFQLIIIDACRDNPFPTKTRSFGNTRGLVPVEPVKGQMVMYSASRGQQALDRLGPSDKNKNSVFTRNLVKELEIIFHMITWDEIIELFPNKFSDENIHNSFVYAKTGTLRHNQALSGYLITQSGRKLAFSFMSNHYTVPPSQIRAEIEKILHHIRDAY